MIKSLPQEVECSCKLEMKFKSLPTWLYFKIASAVITMAALQTCPGVCRKAFRVSKVAAASWDEIFLLK